jgi:hypothetical protein
LIRDAGTQAFGEGGDLVCREAIEEEVGDDEVIGCVARFPVAGVDLVGAHSIAVYAGVAQKRTEHGTAGIDGFDLDVRILVE